MKKTRSRKSRNTVPFSIDIGHFFCDIQNPSYLSIDVLILIKKVFFILQDTVPELEIQSTYIPRVPPVSVPSLELGPPHPLFRKRVCPSVFFCPDVRILNRHLLSAAAEFSTHRQHWVSANQITLSYTV